MPAIKIVVGPDVFCPTCGNGEIHPADTGKPVLERRWLLRPNKVHDGKCWWSQCLVCAGYYDKTLTETTDTFDREKGWFAS